ncbi:bifunctional adenosylcobinamide kinase/adenosylcobinamide-phosphate guanylyltransferase [Rhodococcus sp. TAF43]|uniref:bifunctional adenosylcobinamide kinase/adenosylcobinamide-phosphate guanylyltransferase n=1 Tax=unclassified Rhodococcus (in: high G+C Gram-positive bacteria) TaxID=192944 RepID=UPI000E0BFFE4|nr:MULTISPECIES: bifunctional adenosylcobinamide kinase/adenosylcobinamide-phosphate guanylyltransferase [unclassified Rhodococcus (in: high G+C Gram-positive bacteria)]QKT12079.1 bifunctional adenosylcobinamide kinase/adenosylcobinamide-phosphate guanylyltransferase [Rhodococcus sp. W8901]RDI32549.1 adenosylcobinamide kinase /adenosylcobinamide-phosphate guanylyltransferase [Rhodococcus sp. AG1013]
MPVPSPDSPRPRRTLVLGGARSGKSAHAEGLLDDVEAGAPVRYVATARRYPDDHDWESRIDQHRSRRPASWATVETGRDGDLIDVLTDPDAHPPTLVDDLGTWLTGELDDANAWDAPRGTVEPNIDALVRAVDAYPGRLLLVSPEVGLGVIPETRSGRLFRDEIGALNSRLAAVCDDVILVVAGIALTLK